MVRLLPLLGDANRPAARYPGLANCLSTVIAPLLKSTASQVRPKISLCRIPVKSATVIRYSRSVPLNASRSAAACWSSRG